jgi:integral membrane protein
VTTTDIASAEARAQDGAKAARFRLVSLAEGVSFLILLGIAMPLKYAAHQPWATMVFGMLHGILFLAYVALAFELRGVERWSFKRFAVVLIASVLPTGPFWLHKSLKK